MSAHVHRLPPVPPVDVRIRDKGIPPPEKSCWKQGPGAKLRVRKLHSRMFYLCLTHGALMREKECPQSDVFERSQGRPHLRGGCYTDANGREMGGGSLPLWTSYCILSSLKSFSFKSVIVSFSWDHFFQFLETNYHKYWNGSGDSSTFNQWPGAKLRGATAYRPRHNVLVAGPE